VSVTPFAERRKSVTVISVVLVTELTVLLVAVIVDVPLATAVTIPTESTVATAASDEDHVTV
jgi:hypothetical protein